MNTLEAYTTTGPFGKEVECAKLVVATTDEWFMLTDTTAAGQTYTFSTWVKADMAGGLFIRGQRASVSTEWTKVVLTFVADSTTLPLIFTLADTYYFYHPQLELGTIATDWTPSPEDTDTAVEALIELMNESIRMSITGPDGQSVMTQTENGWTFDITKVSDSKAREEILKLSDRVSDVEDLNDYITIGSHEGQPCIELGEKEKDFKLRITNTQIQFVDGSSVPAYMANQNGVSKLMIEKAEVKGELQIGDFVWQKRANGNVGLMWIGGNG